MAFCDWLLSFNIIFFKVHPHCSLCHYVILVMAEYCCILFLLKHYLLISEREGVGGGGERHLPVVSPTYAFTACFLYVPWWELEPTALAYWEGAVTN